MEERRKGASEGLSEGSSDGSRLRRYSGVADGGQEVPKGNDVDASVTLGGKRRRAGLSPASEGPE
eukprot:2488275-Rhodomonas_salina.1